VGRPLVWALEAVEAAAVARIADFNPQDFSNLIWAFAKLRHTPGRGSHSSTSQLNVSAVCGIGVACRGFLGAVLEVFRGVWGYRVYFVSETAQVELQSG